MQRLQRILLLFAVLYCSCVFGFQPSRAVLKATPFHCPARVTASPFHQPQQQSSRLQAFGGGGFGTPNNFNVKPDTPIENWKDVLKQIREIATGSVRQFGSGFFTGYLAGSAWGLVRGASEVSNKGLAWGLDFGVLSALFSATNSVSRLLLLALPAAKKRPQSVSLWSVVIRNILLSLYFTRAGGYAKMARFAVLYGGATYYFVSQKAKRMSGIGGMPGMPGMGGMGGAGGQPSPAAMQQILQQIMANQQAQASMGTRPNSNQSAPSSSTSPPPSSSTPPPPKKPEKPKGDIVDVEIVDVESESE